MRRSLACEAAFAGAGFRTAFFGVTVSPRTAPGIATGDDGIHKGYSPRRAATAREDTVIQEIPSTRRRSARAAGARLGIKLGGHQDRSELLGSLHVCRPPQCPGGHRPLGAGRPARGVVAAQAIWAVVLFGIFQTSLSGLSVWALYIGSAGKTSVLTYTMPFWLLLIAWPVLGERVRGVQWVAVGLAMGGLLLVLDPWRGNDLTAELLAIGAGLSWAIASLVYKIARRRQPLDLLSFTAWQSLFGSVPLVVAALFTSSRGPTWR